MFAFEPAVFCFLFLGSTQREQGWLEQKHTNPNQGLVVACCFVQSPGKLANSPKAARDAYDSAMNDAARSLYLVCYDIADTRRLYRVHKFLLGYKVGGQKSFFECWLTPAELRDVRQGLLTRMNLEEDRAHIFQLDPRMAVRCLGQAEPPKATTFMIL